MLIPVSLLLLPFILLLYDHGSLWGFSIFIFALSMSLALFLVVYISLTKSFIKDGMALKKPPPNIIISYSNRVKLAILGTILLLLFIADIIWSFEIVNSFYTVFIITFFFYTGGIFSWIFALCDPTFTEIDLNMIRKKKPTIENNDIEEEILLQKDKTDTQKKRSIYKYLIPLLISIGLIIAGLTRILFTDYMTEGVIEIIVGLAAGILAFFTFGKVFDKENNGGKNNSQ